MNKEAKNGTAGQYALTVIARIHSDFKTEFGIPRQSGLIDALTAEVVFEPEFRNADALRGIEGFSHLWLIWQFSAAAGRPWSPTVRPPRLGGNTRMGVFATRSPFRPNALGLSCVRLLDVCREQERGCVLHVAGADLMDGTPILDIKPYLPHGSFTEKTKEYFIPVEIPDELLEKIPADRREALKKVLEQDPRPSYQHDAGRVYGFVFAGCEVRFTVDGEVLTVRSVGPENGA